MIWKYGDLVVQKLENMTKKFMVNENMWITKVWMWNGKNNLTLKILVVELRLKIKNKRPVDFVEI